MASYQEIATSEVVIPEHRRQTDNVKVEALAESIRETGLQHPIGLTRDRRLIHGRHRLEAFRLLGREQIPALIHDVDDLHAELAEIDENIQRSELTALESTLALHRRKKIYEELYPETRQHKAGGHARHNSASDKMSFAEDTARRTGKGRRTIEREVAVAQRLPEDVQKLLLSTPTAKNKSQLEKLARLPEEEQRLVADKLAAGLATTVEQATGSAASKQNDGPGSARSFPEPRCPNCGHDQFDPEDGACLRCYEPDVVCPPPAKRESAEEVTDAQPHKNAGDQESLDNRLSGVTSHSLDQFIEILERDILKHTNDWHAEHPECPWPLMADRIEAMVSRICKNLRA